MIESFGLGDIVMMKKNHACGENRWEITRTGADVKLKCCGCGHVIMMDRVEFMKKGKKILEKSESIPAQSGEEMM